MADQIQYTDKVNNSTSPLPIVNKVRAEDVNEIKSVVNTNATELDGTTSKANTNETNITTNTGNISTNATNIAANTASIALINAAIVELGEGVTIDNGTELRCDKRIYGRRFGSESSPKTETTFTFATTGANAPLEGGYFKLWSQASSIPDPGVAYEDLGYTDNYSTGNKNEIVGTYEDGQLQLRHATTVPVTPPSSAVTDPSSFNFWWDSEATGGTPTDGQLIETWEDAGSNNIDGTSPSANAPAFRAADSSVRGDGTNKYITNTSTGNSAQPFTWVFVFTPQTGMTNFGAIAGVDNNTTGPFIAWRVSGGDQIAAFAGTWSGFVPATIGTRMMVTVVFNGASSEIYLNGATTAAVSGDFGSNNPTSKAVIFGGLDNGSQSEPIDAFSFVEYTGVLSQTEREAMHSYFVSRYSL